MAERAKPEPTRAEAIEAMLQRLGKEYDSAQRRAVIEQVDAAHTTAQVGAILDEYYGNPVYVPVYEGVGDPTRPATWSVERDPEPKSFAELQAEARPPVLPPPSNLISARTESTVINMVEKYHRAFVLLNRVRDYFNLNPDLHDEITDLHDDITEFLKGTP